MVLVVLVATLAFQGAGAVLHHEIEHSHHADPTRLVSHACTHHHDDAPADDPPLPDPSSDCPTCVVLALGFGLTLPETPTSQLALLPALSGVPPDGAVGLIASPFALSHPPTGPPARC